MSIIAVSLIILGFSSVLIDAAPYSVQPYRELQKQFNFRNNRQCYFSPITCIQDPQRNPTLQRIKSKRLYFEPHSSPAHRRIVVFFDRKKSSFI